MGAGCSPAGWPRGLAVWESNAVSHPQSAPSPSSASAASPLLLLTYNPPARPEVPALRSGLPSSWKLSRHFPLFLPLLTAWATYKQINTSLVHFSSGKDETRKTKEVPTHKSSSSFHHHLDCGKFHITSNIYAMIFYSEICWFLLKNKIYISDSAPTW